MHQHANTGLVLKTFSATLMVLHIWACSIHTDPRVMPQPPYLKLILALLVMPTHDCYLIHIRRVLKRVTFYRWWHRNLLEVNYRDFSCHFI